MGSKIEYQPFQLMNLQTLQQHQYLKKLIKMLDKTNVLVKLFNTVRDHDKFTEINLPSIRLRLIGRRNHNSSQFDLLTSNDIGRLIIGDIGEYKKERYNYRNKN